ncbi:chemotaxis protein CheA [Thermodesulfobacteriota bacterium]
MLDRIERIKKYLEDIALEVVTLESKDVQAMGVIMNCLESLESDSQESQRFRDSSFIELTGALKRYLEDLILSETDDIGPLEEGVACLQSVSRAIMKNETFKGDISRLLEKLELKSEEVGEGAVETEVEHPMAAPGGEGGVESQPSEIGEEDQRILAEFVIESLENLEMIEVNLIDLEHDPSDSETINAIFRPFHTIKGVAGFLDLTKINRLAHSAENLLERARSGEVKIEGVIIDIILESVDALKQMIENLKKDLEEGEINDDQYHIEPLIRRIEAAHSEETEMQHRSIGKILLDKGVITKEDLDKGLEIQKENHKKMLGEILMEGKKANSGEIISALKEQRKFGQNQMEFQVKVDTVKLDNLVDLTGELVIAQSMLRQNSSIVSVDDQKLIHTLSQLTQITSGLQTAAMSMRMVPIKNTFQKMVRLVRDLARNSGKNLRLEMSGEDTEIDRNVVDELYEPMVHMIRNAVDHGIEEVEERKREGKDQAGTIHLSACHRAGNIVIEIADDGRGLERNKIVEKARSTGIISDDGSLADNEIYQLIFRPGFSTAEKVTDISGRGVGMDVVKRAIEKLRGRVEINSRPGSGSVFNISLPLTLAIIEGMVVRVGRERYIIPTLAILETFKLKKAQYSTVEGKGEMILQRGSLLPMVRLDHICGVKSDYINPWEGLVVTVEHEEVRMCLLLDELLGKEEVVIKTLGEGLRNVKGIAGGAIMGDGKVSLILDMSGIFELAKAA